ncbi:lipase maturation factor 1-like [Patiria miniata]|uniref:Lipase maturation factor n=1 Tax=Patiria miniata TaxID=46514 RepID=A0A914AL65_PATMI|nr:lipase maturation factor 1-like [Patiria miniata]
MNFSFLRRCRLLTCANTPFLTYTIKCALTCQPSDQSKMAAAMDHETSGIRKRKQPAGSSGGEVTEPDSRPKDHSDTDGPNASKDRGQSVDLEPNSYWLTRIVFLRSLAFIYLTAFLVALHQNKQLMGRDGLLPTRLYLDRIKNYVGGEVNVQALSFAPTILWFVDVEGAVDYWLDALAYAGVALSGFVLVLGSANMVVMVMLWLLYHSLVSVGQRWYSFGWESQLLETGFLAIFMCPLLSLRQYPRRTPTPWVTLWGYRWLIFRIMIGAGLIKIRGDQCWRDLTCMNYHYETQPVPNPISYYLHQTPEAMHKFETLSNHFVELVVPIFILIPWRPTMLLAGGIQIFFQVVLIISGNLSFLNWLTILPSLCCFDDRSLAWLFPGWLSGAKATVRQIQREDRDGTGPQATIGVYVRRVLHISLALLIAYLSIPVVSNLLSTRQAMNTSFDPLRLVNTYGAFGSITKERTEVIFEGTYATNPKDPSAVWLEYEFICKPGNVTRRPCLISPYHYRLDWLMWFAAFQSYESNPWLVHLAGKFLYNDEGMTSLIAHNPFQNGNPPRFVRALHYRYQYTKIGSKQSQEGAWWTRKFLKSYLPPVSLESLESYIRSQSWDLPKYAKRKLREQRRAKKGRSG